MTSGADWIWEELGLEATDDSAAIRRAYAARLKAIDTEADPDAFILLRHARDAALAHAEGGEVERPPPPRERKAEPGDETVAQVPPPTSDEPEASIESMSVEPEAEAVTGVAPDLPELPGADLERIQAILFGGAAPDSPDELETLTRRILAEPAAERIDVARWLESWMAEAIAHSMPLSDPMIAPAAEHFRWGQEESDLNRPPVIDYILQRTFDHEVEAELARTPARYDLLLAELRRPPMKGKGGFGAWWRGPRIEYLLAYLQAYRPTLMRTLNQDTLDWWNDHFAHQREARGATSSLRENRRQAVWDQGFGGTRREVDLLLGVGIMIMPYICAWALLRRGHSNLSRALGLGWLALSILAIALSPNPPPSGSIPASATDASPPTPVFLNLADDVGDIVTWMTTGLLSLEDIVRTNPSVHEALADSWWESKNAGGDPVRLLQSVANLLERDYCARPSLASAQAICNAVRTRKTELPVSLAAMQSADAGHMNAELEPMIRSLTASYLRLDTMEFDKPSLYSAIAARWRRAKLREEGQPALELAIADLLRDEYCSQPNTSQAERVCFGMAAARSNRAEAARRSPRE